MHDIDVTEKGERMCLIISVMQCAYDIMRNITENIG